MAADQEKLIAAMDKIADTITANIDQVSYSHIRDLAEAYSLLAGAEKPKKSGRATSF
jgi:DNA-binding MurR/RpiR family transcriptional regulator